MNPIALASSLLFSLLFTASAQTQERAGDSVSSAVFGASKLARKSLALTSEEQGSIDRARDSVLFEIRASGESFWEILTDGNPTAIDANNRNRLLRQFSESVILVWGTPGEAPCSRDSQAACSIVRDYSDVHAFGFVIDPCFLSTRATPQCKMSERFYDGLIKKNPSLLSAIRRALAHGAVRFADEIRTHSERKPNRERLEQLLSDTEEAAARLKSACPGPYPKVFSTLLTQAKLIRPIENSYVQTCGMRYVGAPYGSSANWSQVPKVCREILDEQRWMAWRAAQTAKPFRCGSACSELLCFGDRSSAGDAEYFEGADETRPPRLIWFDRSALLDLPENSCNGPDPTRMEDFLRHSYLPFVVKPQFASRRDPHTGRYDLPAAWLPCLRTWSSGQPEKSAQPAGALPAKNIDRPGTGELPPAAEDVTFDLN